MQWRAIGIKWNCVWIDRDPGKFVSGFVAGRNNDLTDQFVKGNVSIGVVIEM